MEKLNWAFFGLLGLLWGLAPAGLSQNSSSIRGTVRNGTSSSPLADVEVTLTSPAGGLSGERSTRTDGSGRFQFNDVPIRGFYLARVVHQDIVYNAATSFSEAGQPAVVEIVVYDAATPDEVPLTLSRVKSTFRVLGEIVEIERLYRVSNPSLKTLPGTSDAFRFQIEELTPDLASQARQSAWLDVSVVPTADQQAHTVRFDLKPGETDVYLHYHLPYTDRRFLAEEVLFHPAAEVVIEVGPDGMQLNPTPTLDDAGWQAGAQVYQAKDIDAGQTLSVEIQGEAVGGASVTGTVRNGTTGETEMAVPLELTRIGRGGHDPQGSPHGGEQDVENWTAVSNDDGRFAFENIPVEPGSFFFLRGSHAGADYNLPIRFAEEKVVDVELEVFDAAPRSSVKLAIDVPDLLLYVDGHRLVHRAYYRVENASRTTVEPEGSLVFGLPATAENVRCNVFSMIAQQMIPNERRPRPVPGRPGVVAVDWPLKPGPTLMEVYYELPYEGEIDLEIPLPDGVDLIAATIGPSTLDVRAPRLKFKKKTRPEPQPGRPDYGELFQYAGGPFQPGSLVTISLVGEAHMPGSIIPSMSSWNRGWQFLITTLVSAMMLIMVAVGLALRGSSDGAQRREHERDVLLSELVRLDDAIQEGKVGRGEYEEKRQVICGRLREIWSA